MSAFEAGKTALPKGFYRPLVAGFFTIILVVCLAGVQAAQAQDFRFSTVRIDGNLRIEDATILTYAGISQGETLTAGQLNDAYQNILASGLFESISVTPQGGTLLISVVEFPTINQINIEGNKRLKDEDLLTVVQSKPRLVYNPTVAEADALAIAEAYALAGRTLATVTPKIIRRSNNRVDLVFEIGEGEVVEIERLSFTGNRAYSDRRLRRVLESKQAGLLRRFISRDTFIADRIEFDKQVLTDFYLSRGYVDFQILSVSSNVSRERDGYFVAFNIREGQSFKINNVTATSELPDVDPEEFLAASKLKSGVTYSPIRIENTIQRMERLALAKSLNFIRVVPNISRNDRELTLDIEFEIVRSERLFIERIDIEGNTTTLDRVIRNQFRIVEGDPFNPREIRESAERIRALGFFASAEVNGREGSAPDQVIVDVDVEEQPTGSLSLGGSYSVSDGPGITIGFSENNFLGRGQRFSASVVSGTDSNSSRLTFSEPNLLGRDLRAGISIFYVESNYDDTFYDTRLTGVTPSLAFPVSKNGRLRLNYTFSENSISDISSDSSPIIVADAGTETKSAFGYTYSYDTRRTGLDPNTGLIARISQDIAGFGGSSQFIKTEGLIGVETKIFREEVTIRAVFEGGALHSLSGNSRATERFFLSDKMRGFESGGVGPRDLNVTNEDALGGNLFALARFEADFPVGLPEEYGLSAGVFLDIGSTWSLNNTDGGSSGTDGLELVDDSLIIRSTIGFSIFWTTAIGPLRFNFSKALLKESYDNEQTFDLTISTSF